MILANAQVYPVAEWFTDYEQILAKMRDDLTAYAHENGYEVDPSDVHEMVFFRYDRHGAARAIRREKATHVRVSMERPAEEIQ